MADFSDLLGPDLLAALEGERDTVFGVWTDGTLAYTNAAWKRMALTNDGDKILSEWPLGRSVWEAIPDVLQSYYRESWTGALGAAAPFEHDYECSSPTQYRKFRMRVESVKGMGLLIRNHLRVECAHTAAASGAARNEYVSDNGFIAVCANCRRTRRVGEPESWDWVPSLIATPGDSVTHGLCAPCFELYYPAG